MSAKPHIAVDARVLVDPPAGVGYYTRALLAHLAERGNLRLTALSHRSPLNCDALAAAGVTLETVASPLGFWWQQRSLPRRLRDGFDLLWSPVGTLPQSSPIPAVVTVHDLTPLLFPYWHSLRNRVTFKRQLPATLRSAVQIVAVSRATAGDLERRFPTTTGRITVVPPGIDADFVPGTSSQIAAIRRSLNAADGYVLFVGTLEPRKNLPRLLDAWQRLQDQLPDTVPLLVAGAKGWHSRGLRRRLGRAPGVRYLGRLSRPRLIEAFQGATVFAYPSLYEGFGLPVAEAMACGVPVVTSDCSSLPEVIGDCGLLVNPRDPKRLAAALERLLTDGELRSDLRTRALDRATSFSWERSAEQLESVLLHAVEAPR